MAKLNSGTRIYGNLQVDTFITASGNVVAASSQASTSTTTGALVVVGGVGIAGATTIAGNVTIGTTTLSTRANLYVSGGNLNATAGSTLKVAEFHHTNANASYLQIIAQRYAQGADWQTANTRIQLMTDVTSQGYIEFNPIGAQYGLAIGTQTTESIRFHQNGNVVIKPTTASTSTTTGALVVVGGVGVAGNLYIGGSAGTAIVHTGNIIPSSNLTANLGSPTAWYNTFFGVSTQAKYADLAENYVGDAEYAPGTVLVFGGAKEVTVTNMTHDTRVAGVVSTNPAYLMNSMNGNVAVAMTGRVPCQVQGPVEKGTVLVSSHIPGVAEALNSGMYRPGCVLGKALEQIDSTDIKTIEVVVGRF
jgi:hypothetical protein